VKRTKPPFKTIGIQGVHALASPKPLFEEYRSQVAMRFLIITAFLVLSIQSTAQQASNSEWLTAERIDIPFDFTNGFIIISLTINGRFPVRFIFDTGAENTIITKREITDLLRVPYDREFTILGSDMTTELTAYLVRNIDLNIANKNLLNQPLLVLEEDYFRFEAFTGEPIHGIVGANIFRNKVVCINYQRRQITLFHPGHFESAELDEAFTEIPIQIKKNKPYLFAPIRLPNQDTLSVKLLIDTGASLPLLLTTQTHPNLQLPEQVIPGNIGMGLGGRLEGYIGRIRKIELGQYTIQEIPTNFQEITPEMDTSFLQQRNGIIGNQLLRKFTVYIDYLRSKMYLRPNRYINKEFKMDKSGLVIVAGGRFLDLLIVQGVLPRSPAAESGILPGDVIKRINGIPVGLMSLSDVDGILKKKEGKKIKIVFEQQGEKKKRIFRLRNLF
jgi:predicted aspartyl protease